MLRCKNCKNQFSGKFCNNCGEKIIEESDFSIKNIIAQGVDLITNLDSKFFKTIKLLLFFPGSLTKKYVTGVRVPYMKPLQIFVIANVLFFIFLSDVAVFRVPAKWFFVENYDSINVLDIVGQVSGELNLTQKEIAKLYDIKSTNLAKGLIILLIPFIASIVMMLNYRKKIQFGKHIIFSIHLFAFILLFSIIWSECIDFLFLSSNNVLYSTPITIVNIIYFTIALKNTYKDTWMITIVKGIVGMLLMGVTFRFYSIGISLFTLNTL